MDDAFLGEYHVLGHGALHIVLEAIQVVFLAHPVLAVVAEAAAPARHDLLGDHPVTHGHAALLGAWAKGDHAAHELMPGDHRRLHVARLLGIAPERRRAAIGLDIAHANAAQLDLGEDLVGTGGGHVDGFQAVIFRAVADHGLHGFRDAWGELFRCAFGDGGHDKTSRHNDELLNAVAAVDHHVRTGDHLRGIAEQVQRQPGDFFRPGEAACRDLQFGPFTHIAGPGFLA